MSWGFDNNVTAHLKKEKVEWQRGKLDDSVDGSNSGKLWRDINGRLDWSSTGSPTKLFCQGNIETSPLKMADV